MKKLAKSTSKWNKNFIVEKVQVFEWRKDLDRKYRLRQMKESDISELFDIFCSCFANDEYYCHYLIEDTVGNKSFPMLFKTIIAKCVINNYVIGAIFDNEIAGFCVCLDYFNTYNNNRDFFDVVFEFNNGEYKFQHELHDYIFGLKGKVLYMLTICVKKSFQGKKIASYMLDSILSKKDYNYLVSDISNVNSLSMYLNRNFQLKTITNNYYLVIKEIKEGAIL